MKNTNLKQVTIQHLIFLSLTTYIFFGCVKQDKVSSIQTLKATKIVSDVNVKDIINSPKYGQYTDEIQKFLSATPLGSEIYLEQKESGEWYLKVEKTFTAKKDEEKIEMSEPIYGESILI